MNLDNQMTASLLSCVKTLNIKIRSSIITDDTKLLLKPLIKTFKVDCTKYRKLLLKPGNVSTSKLLQAFKNILKDIKLSTNDTIVAKTQVAIDFIQDRIDEIENPEPVVEETETGIAEEDTKNTDADNNSDSDTEDTGDSSTDIDDATIADSEDTTITDSEDGEVEDTEESDEPIDTDEEGEIASTDEPIDVDADDSTDENG